MYKPAKGFSLWANNSSGTGSVMTDLSFSRGILSNVLALTVTFLPFWSMVAKKWSSIVVEVDFFRFRRFLCSCEYKSSVGWMNHEFGIENLKKDSKKKKKKKKKMVGGRNILEMVKNE